MILQFMEYGETLFSCTSGNYPCFILHTAGVDQSEHVVTVNRDSLLALAMVCLRIDRHKSLEREDMLDIRRFLNAVKDTCGYYFHSRFKEKVPVRTQGIEDELQQMTEAFSKLSTGQLATTCNTPLFYNYWEEHEECIKIATEHADDTFSYLVGHEISEKIIKPQLATLEEILRL